MCIQARGFNVGGWVYRDAEAANSNFCSALTLLGFALVLHLEPDQNVWWGRRDHVRGRTAQRAIQPTSQAVLDEKDDWKF